MVATLVYSYIVVVVWILLQVSVAVLLVPAATDIPLCVPERLGLFQSFASCYPGLAGHNRIVRRRDLD